MTTLENSNDKATKNIIFFFKTNFWRYDTKNFIELLNSKHNVIVAQNEKEIIDNLEKTDVIIVSSEACNVIELVFNNDPSFLKEKKIIFIRTNTSWDILHVDEKFLSKKNVYLKNIYLPLNSLLFDKKGENLDLPKYRNYVDLLYSYGNIEKMPIYTCSKTPRRSKEIFFEKYNLDIKKDLFTIFLMFPKNYNFVGNDSLNNYIETYFCNNYELMNNVVKHLQKTFNVVFKPHPLYGMKFKPFKTGNYWDKISKKRTAIPLTTMEPYINNYQFVEIEDGHDLNIYTKLGLIFSRTTFSYINYLFDIPLLYVSSKTKFIENQLRNELKDKFDMEKIFYGQWSTVELFQKKHEQILNSFIQEFSKSTNNFKYKHDNILYGDSYNLNIQAWVDYTNNVINKPIK